MSDPASRSRHQLAAPAQVPPWLETPPDRAHLSLERQVAPVVISIRSSFPPSAEKDVQGSFGQSKQQADAGGRSPAQVSQRAASGLAHMAWPNQMPTGPGAGMTAAAARCFALHVV
ncbi:hypothetical protein GGTG_00568 [Gaeumannomyces tritici R3-111a-1]|uniref:Uncharacterized protein n=1 Tax=Gaeumannomyces tritici (strain R3-111a-1) TaxID=644352 RepID=J3NH30_GAET3|nr:hypothetical protein GGTG_00568 [Gaeumannomyces tritici R3-111a-1]EJT80573.1 hypothetical protein GGTG_00568 [Gaeumannomyces tritici R3-111a-1]